VNTVRDPLTSKNVRTVLLVAGIALIVVRIVLQALWSVVWYSESSNNMLVDVLLNIVSDLILVCIAGTIFYIYAERKHHEVSYDSVAGSVAFYAVSALALLFVSALVPAGIDGGRPINVVGVITSNLVAIGTFIISLVLAGFIAHMLLSRRHMRTHILLYMQVAVVIGIWGCTIVDALWAGFAILAFLLSIAGVVLMLMNMRRLNWLSSISFDRKIRLLWLSVCGAFASIVFALTPSFGSEDYITASTDLFVHSGAAVPAIINMFGFVFFVRLFIAIIGSLPNSGIVDRRSDEVESLAGLTRLMTGTATVEDLLKSVTGHAMRVCHAHGAWCELYDEDGLHVIAAQMVHEDWVRSLHANEALHRMLTQSAKPILVDSVEDALPAYGRSVGLQSFVAIPLLRENKRQKTTERTGTLVMFSTVEFGFESDDMRLLTAFGDTISVALEQAKLLEAALATERLQKEVEVARSIQSSLLPRNAPSTESFDIDSVTIPAHDVGGDYYDYVCFSSGSHGAIIADVSGKGVPAALYMATLKGVVLAEMRSALGPADLLRRVNTTLHGSMERHTYITMACVEFDATCRSLRLARAGHTPTILRRGDKTFVITPGGFAIGIVSPEVFDAALEEVVIAVEAGDICLLTTDGVTERRDANLVEIGLAPIMDMLEALKPTTANEVVVSTMALLEEHAGSEPHDDITIVALIVRGANA